ncbi:MAG: hypothetical protein AAFY39_04330 [Pseudomonadota bacterium]
MLTGTCHCGVVKWTFSTEPSSATACNCTVCAKAGVLWIYGILGENVTLTGQTARYLRRDQQTLEFITALPAATQSAGSWPSQTATARRKSQ